MDSSDLAEEQHGVFILCHGLVGPFHRRILLVAQLRQLHMVCVDRLHHLRHVHRRYRQLSAEGGRSKWKKWCLCGRWLGVYDKCSLRSTVTVRLLCFSVTSYAILTFLRKSPNVQVLLEAPVGTGLGTVIGITVMGANDFMDFLLSYFVNLGLIMLFRVNIDPALGDILERISRM